MSLHEQAINSTDVTMKTVKPPQCIWIAYFSLFVFVAFTTFYRLGDSPAPWYDEGEFLQTARTFAETDRYAISLLDGLRGAHLSVGPTALLPPALLFRMFGQSLFVGRCFHAVSFVLAVLLIAWFSHRKFGPLAGLISSGAFIFADYLGIAYWSRTVIGEFPALAYMLVAIHLLDGQQTSRVTIKQLCASLLLGAALIAKPQFVIVLSGILVSEMTNFSISAVGRFRRILLLGLPIVLTVALGLLVTTSGIGVINYIEQLKMLSKVSDLVLYPALTSRLGSNLRLKLPELMLLVSVVNSWYLLSSWQKTKGQIILKQIFISAVVWLLWYITVAPEWTRHVLGGAALSFILMGGAVAGLLERCNARVRNSSLAVLLLSVIILGGNRVRATLDAPDYSSLKRFVSCLDSVLSGVDRPMTYEWEVQFLSKWRYLQPDFHSHYTILRRIFSDYTWNGELDENNKRQLYRDATHVISGPFGSGIFKVFSLNAIAPRGEIICRESDYTLIKLINEPEHSKSGN